MHYVKLDVDLTTDDWRFLNYIAITYLSKTQSFNRMSVKFENYKDFFLKNSSNNYRTQPIFKKIAELFKNNTKHSDPEYVYNASQLAYVPGKLVPHKDARSCTITIPLVPVSSVYWFRDKTKSGRVILNDPELYEPIDEYDYRYPVTLIDTHTFHGAPDNITPRIFFQVSAFYEKFELVTKTLR